MLSYGDGESCFAFWDKGRANIMDTNRERKVYTSKCREFVPFGCEMRRKHFLFEDGFINLNHGTCLSYVKVSADAD